MRSSLDEQDLALLHALQIAPRVSWAEAARVLGSTSTTLAGRWERLRSEGLAWVTAHPGHRLNEITVAFVEIDLAPSDRADAVETLCRDPRAVTVEESAGARDLMLTVMVSDHDALGRFVLDDLPRTRGVRRTSTRVATRMHWEGSRWRLDALDRDQQVALHSAARLTSEAPLSRIPPGYQPLVEALSYDGRRNAADIARLHERNPATVRRQVARLLSSDLLSFRCEIAQVRSRWPIVCTWFAQVPIAELERTVRSLTTLPELRLCVSIAGEANLMFTLWVQSPGDLMRVERLLGAKLPSLTLLESALMLRTPKRMGWLMRPDGCSTGEVVPSLVHADPDDVDVCG